MCAELAFQTWVPALLHVANMTPCGCSVNFTRKYERQPHQDLGREHFLYHILHLIMSSTAGHTVPCCPHLCHRIEHCCKAYHHVVCPFVTPCGEQRPASTPGACIISSRPHVHCLHQLCCVMSPPANPICLHVGCCVKAKMRSSCTATRRLW